jgi:hypothetical protein
MRSVRCDSCGTKALMAASQCPKCSHLFEVRDGFGALLPLAYCSSCESYYRESVGECKWCGTKPEPAPRSPLMWKRVGIGGLVALAWLGWLLRDPRPKPAAHAKASARPKPESTYVALETDTIPASVPDVVPVAPPPPVDTVPARVTAVSAGSVAQQSLPATPVEQPRATVRGPVSAPARAFAHSAAPTLSSPKSRSSSRWVNSIAKSWVVVRADSRRDARIVASIGPDSRVQLGESRGAWRRIRSRGIAGWVDEGRASFATRGATGANGLAAR